MSLEAYGRYWETLRPASVGELRALARADLLFRDPFQEIRGVDAVIAMLERMFRHTAEPRFTVTRVARDGEVGFIRWGFTCAVRGRPLAIEGVTEVVLAGDGRVAAHLDHWDAASQVYAHLPLIGPPIRWLARRIARA